MEKHDSSQSLNLHERQDLTPVNGGNTSPTLNQSGNNTKSELLGLPKTLNSGTALKPTNSPQKQKQVSFNRQIGLTTDQLKQLDSQAQKKFKFFPDKIINDSYLEEFVVSKNGNKQLYGHKLDPDVVKYNQPDFGFDSDLCFEDPNTQQRQSMWLRFLSCVSIFPKYERVSNYVEFVNQKKIQRMMGGSQHGRRISQLGSLQDRRQHIDKFRDQEVYSKLQEAGPKELDPKLNMSKRELKNNEISQGVQEIQNMINSEQKFLKFLRKKAAQNEYQGSDSDSELIEAQSPIQQPKKRMQRRAKYMQYKTQSRVDLEFNESSLLGKSFKNDLLKAKFLVQKTVHEGKKNLESAKYLASSKPESEAFRQITKRTCLDTSRESSRFDIRRIPSIGGRSIKAINFQEPKAFSKLNEEIQRLKAPDTDEVLITKLSYKLADVLQRMDAARNHYQQKSEVETVMAQQGLRYLNANEIHDISPFFHLSIMINSSLLSTEEVAQNARLILQFAQLQQRKLSNAKDEYSYQVANEKRYNQTNLPHYKDYSEQKRNHRRDVAGSPQVSDVGLNERNHRSQQILHRINMQVDKKFGNKSQIIDQSQSRFKSGISFGLSSTDDRNLTAFNEYGLGNLKEQLVNSPFIPQVDIHKPRIFRRSKTPFQPALFKIPQKTRQFYSVKKERLVALQTPEIRAN